MNADELSLSGWISSRDAAVRPIHAVAIYDEWSSLVYAQEALNALMHSTGGNLQLHRSIWSFSMLMRLDVRHESIRVASEADIIIVASASSSRIPSHVISWLNSTLRDNGMGAPVLVALDVEGLEQSDAASEGISDLRVVATRWGSPLICNAEFDDRLEQGLITELTGRYDARYDPERDSNFYKLLSVSPSGGWGLNE